MTRGIEGKNKPAALDDMCVVYCRVSSERQATEDKGSLDDQERNGLTKAKELGLHVLYVVKDAESAWILENRSKFQRVLDDARAGKFSHLVVDRMNRFTRSEDLSDYMAVMAELKSAKVKMHFADKDYEQSPTGQLLMTMDAWQSAMEQANRRKQSLVGKRARVTKLGRPLAGSWPPYGYRWIDAEKTQLEKDDGGSQAVVERIWRTFLFGEHASLSGLAKALDEDHIKPPMAYAGVKQPKDAVKSGPRWTAVSISMILHNELYWGGDENGTVATFKTSKYEEPVRLPTYAPPYVTREEAMRVHARLASNKKYAPRNQRHEWDTLLNGGLARCAECGWGLTPYKNWKARADGTILTLYRCPHKPKHPHACGGVSISAELLDLAVEQTLHAAFDSSHYLKELFAAWDRDAETAMGRVRALEREIKDTEQQIDNLTGRLATYALGDHAAAPVEAHIRRLAEPLPGLRVHLERAQEAVRSVRNNPKLRDDIMEWFEGWMFGFSALSRDKKRQFLFALNAKVLLWRADQRTPRAQLVIELPIAPLSLPLSPSLNPQQDEAGAWRIDVDLEESAKALTSYREWVAGGGSFDFEKTALDETERREHTTAEEAMNTIKETLQEEFGTKPTSVNCIKPIGAP